MSFRRHLLEPASHISSNRCFDMASAGSDVRGRQRYCLVIAFHLTIAPDRLRRRQAARSGQDTRRPASRNVSSSSRRRFSRPREPRKRQFPLAKQHDAEPARTAAAPAGDALLDHAAAPASRIHRLRYRRFPLDPKDALVLTASDRPPLTSREVRPRSFRGMVPSRPVETGSTDHAPSLRIIAGAVAVAG